MDSQGSGKIRIGSSAVEKALAQLNAAREAYERARSEALILRHAGLLEEADRRVQENVDPSLDQIIRLEEGVLRAPVSSVRDLARQISVVAANDFEAVELNELLADNAREILEAA